MTDLSALGLQKQHVDEWEQYFRSGRVFAARLDADGARRRMRANTVVLAVCAVVGVAALATLILMAVTDLGRIATYVLLGILVIAAAGVALKFVFARRRLRAGLSGASEYLVISTQGVRLADALELPWTSVTGGVGVDARNAPVAGVQRFAARVSRASGVAEAEMTLGLSATRATRDGAPAHLHGLFEVIADHGGIRVPVDTMVPADQVKASLAAMTVAGRMAGVDIDLPADRSAIVKRAMEVLGPQKPRPDAAEPKETGA